MASATTIARLDAAIWTLIYGGLLAIVLGVAVQGEALVAAWSLGIVGALLTGAGVVLLWVRSRMQEDGQGSAQSGPSQGIK